MKFSTKLILSFFVVTLLLLSIGLASQYLNKRVKDQVVEESEKAIKELELSGEMGVLLFRSLINTQYFLEDRYRKSLNNGIAASDLNTEQAQERIKEALADFDSSLLATEVILNSQKESARTRSDSLKLNSEILEQLKSKFSNYSALVEQLIPLAEQDYDDGKEFFTITIEPYFRTSVLPLVDQLREETEKNLDNEVAKLNAELNETSQILTIATVGAFILSLILAYYLYRSIATPLQALAVAAQHIGSGNLDERIDVNSKDEIGQLGMEFNKMAQNLSRTTVSRNFMDDIIESMADALIVTDEYSCIQRINSATVDMLGYTEAELLGKPIDFIFAENHTSDIVETQSAGTIKNHETSYLTKDGNRVLVSLSRALIHDSVENVRGLVCVASDITMRKAAEKQVSKSLREKEILLAEIHHRVKNNLAVISGLLQMQIWETENEVAETALKDSQLRVQSIALVHEKLYQSESLSFIEFDKYIRDLLQAIGSTYIDSSVSVTIKTELEEVVLNINQAIPCSLLLNELVVNAHKHAFPDNSKGVIMVQLCKERDGDTIFLRVKDNGRGLADDYNIETSESLGMSLVGTLARQLNGEIQIYNDEGAVFELSFNQEGVVSHS